MNFRMQIVNMTESEKTGSDVRANFLLPFDYSEVEQALNLKGFPNCSEQYRIVAHHSVDDFLEHTERPADDDVEAWNRLYYMLAELAAIVGDMEPVRCFLGELHLSVDGLYSLKDQIRIMTYSDDEAWIQYLFDRYGGENVFIYDRIYIIER